jgi:RES domain-containing protein
MRVWRLVKAVHKESAFTGEGAKLYPGRWNRKGMLVVYTAESLSLAILETLVHLRVREFKVEYSYFGLDIPDKVKIEEVRVEDLTGINWKANPPDSSSQQIGSEWAERGSSAVLKLPSIINPEESSSLVNPTHRDFKKIKVGKPKVYRFDPRILKSRGTLSTGKLIPGRIG